MIGLAGGIGAGKSHVAAELGRLGCVVIDSDALAKSAWVDPAVSPQLRKLVGPDAFDAAGNPDRRAIAKKLFADDAMRRQVEAIIHAVVEARRNAIMQSSPAARAFVFDSPLLFEAGLNKRCDAVIFVDTPDDVRARRVAGRGWSMDDLKKREAAQWPLEKKKSAATHSVSGVADATSLRGALAAILDELTNRPAAKPETQRSS